MKNKQCLVCGRLYGHTDTCKKIIHYIYYDKGKPYISKAGHKKFKIKLWWEK